MTLTLRDRHKIQIRSTLIETALRNFKNAGFDAVTVTVLCAEAEVSKRTFFRYFTSKEQVALAPLTDLWQAFLARVESGLPSGTALSVLTNALIEAILEMPDGWERQACDSSLIAATTPRVEAAGMYDCEQVTEAALRLLAERLPPDADVRRVTPLVRAALVTCFREAMQNWQQSTDHDRATLCEELRQTSSAWPKAVRLTFLAQR